MGVLCLNFTVAQCTIEHISISLHITQIFSYTIKNWLPFIDTSTNTSCKVTNYFD